MPQLNLNFTEVPEQRTLIWEQLDPRQKQLVVDTLARLLTKILQPENPEHAVHD